MSHISAAVCFCFVCSKATHDYNKINSWLKWGDKNLQLSLPVSNLILWLFTDLYLSLAAAADGAFFYFESFKFENIIKIICNKWLSDSLPNLILVWDVIYFMNNAVNKRIWTFINIPPDSLMLWFSSHFRLKPQLCSSRTFHLWSQRSISELLKMTSSHLMNVSHFDPNPQQPFFLELTLYGFDWICTISLHFPSWHSCN